MKLIILMFSFILAGCNTMNAAIDGGQHVLNSTIEATGEGVANITSAVGTDITDTITYGTEGLSKGIREVTTLDSKDKE